MRTTRRSVTGFTLIELMITVAVIAILVAVAMPSYRNYVIRSKRAAAQAAMLDLANREQQYLIANRVFADTSALTANGYLLPEEVRGSYTWAVTTTSASNGPPTFLITLTPIGGQASDGQLTLNEHSVRTPADKWQR